MQTGHQTEVTKGCTTCGYHKEGFFCHFPPDELKELDAIRMVSEYPAGSMLFIEREPPRGIYILCEGRVKICFTSRSGKTLVLRIAAPGEALGMEAVLAGRPLEATAETLARSQIAFVPGREFKQFLSRHPGVLQRVVMQAASDYDMACKQLEALGLGRSVLRKIANFLSERCRGERARQNRTTLSLGLSHEQIAEYLGTTRESVTRSMSVLRNNGLVEQDGDDLIILDRSALQSFGNS